MITGELSKEDKAEVLDHLSYLCKRYDIDITEMPKPGKERKPLSFYNK